MRKWGTAFAVALVGLSTSGCWLQVGGNAARTGSVSGETTLTASNAATLHQVWSKDLGPYGATAPLVNGGRVFVSSANLMTALNAGTGAQLWQVNTTSDPYTPLLGDLALYQDRVLTTFQIASVGGTYSFDQATGAFTADGGSFGDPYPYNAPAVAGSTLALVEGAANLSGAVSLVRYGAHTGLINFWSNLSDARPATSPMLRGNQVFVGSDTTVLAFPTDSCTPSPAPGFCLASWTTGVGSVAGMPVSLSATQLAVPLANGNVAVLDAATGALQWTAVTGSTSAQPPALDATSFYVGTTDGKVRAFPIAGCGNPTCSPTSTSSAAGAAISSQPVVAGGVVYVGTANGKFIAFNTAGVSLFSTTVNASASRVFVVEDNASVYATTNNGTVAAYRLP